MKVTTPLLTQVAKTTLAEHQASICQHIDSIMEANRYTGIEAAFADPFDRCLADMSGVFVDRRRTTEDIGSQNYFSRKGNRGRVDAVFEESGSLSAAEYKAVRMPRRKGNPLFDISQIAADGQRMRQARHLRKGWVVVFLYGPVVEDCGSGSSLLRDFLGQMFLECQNAIAGELMWQGDDGNFEHTRLMGWHKAPYDERRPPAAGVKVGRLGAVIVECK